MNKKLLTIIFTTLTIASIVIYSKNYQKLEKNSSINYEEYFSKLKSGDIIFRKESSLLSDLFSQVDNSTYSHIGIVFKKENQTLIYHMESNEEEKDLKINSLDEFLILASNIAVYRHNEKIDFSNLVNILKNYENSNISFDYSFDLKNDDLYCTEFINEIYLKLTNKNIYNYLYEVQGKKVISIKGIRTNSKLKKIAQYNKKQ